jgi:WD40 repeat protein
MDPGARTPPEFRIDAFISYSRKDREFAHRLEQELRRYRPPRDLPVPQRHLRVFRDEADFTGGEYHESLDRNLKDACKLIVVCSPRSAASPYVADEIRRFAAHRGKEHIVPLLLDGLPNNEVLDEDSGRRAFPEELVRLLPMPLAADYRGWGARRGKLGKGAFASAWFKTLADVYVDYGVDRAAVEQRERRREAQRLRTIAALSSAVALALVALTTWALVSRSEARRQRDNSEARRNETEARLVFGESGAALLKATLYSVASVRLAPTVDGQVSLMRFLDLLPQPPAWRRSGARTDGRGTRQRQTVLAVRPDGSRIARTDMNGNGPVHMLDARTGEPVASFEVDREPAGRTVLTFSPDGSLLVLGCAHQACVIDAASGALLARLPGAEERHGTMVWAASFSPEGSDLATSSYGSSEAIVYEVPSWRVAARLRGDTSSVFAVAFSSDGQWLALSSASKLQLWRVGRFEAPAAVANVSDIVWSLAFRSDGKGLVTAGREVQAWTIVTEGSTVRLAPGAAIQIQAHTLSPLAWHGQRCFVAAAADGVHVLCGEPFREVLRVPVPSAAAAVGPDGRTLFNDQGDDVLAAWPLESGLEALRLRLGSPIRGLAGAEPAGWLAAATEGAEVVVIDRETWKEWTRLRLPAPATTVNASADGHWLAVGAGSTVHVFDTGTWREAASRDYGGDVSWAGFDADDRWLVVAAGRTIVVLQPRDWSERLRVDHDGRVQAVRLRPDGSELATVTHWAAGHDSGVHQTRVFDLATRRETAWAFESGSGNISQAFLQREAARQKRAPVGGDAASVAASASWTTLGLTEPRELTSGDRAWALELSGSVVELRDTASTRTVGRFDHGDQVTSARFVPVTAPRWLVSAGKDGTLAVWPVRTKELADQACARLQAVLGTEALAKLVAETHTVPSCGAK